MLKDNSLVSEQRRDQLLQLTHRMLELGLCLNYYLFSTLFSFQYLFFTSLNLPHLTLNFLVDFKGRRVFKHLLMPRDLWLSFSWVLLMFQLVKNGFNLFGKLCRVFLLAVLEFDNFIRNMLNITVDWMEVLLAILHFRFNVIYGAFQAIQFIKNGFLLLRYILIISSNAQLFAYQNVLKILPFPIFVVRKYREQRAHF